MPYGSDYPETTIRSGRNYSEGNVKRVLSGVFVSVDAVPLKPTVARSRRLIAFVARQLMNVDLELPGSSPPAETVDFNRARGRSNAGCASLLGEETHNDFASRCLETGSTPYNELAAVDRAGKRPNAIMYPPQGAARVARVSRARIQASCCRCKGTASVDRAGEGPKYIFIAAVVSGARRSDQHQQAPDRHLNAAGARSDTDRQPDQQ